MAYIPTTTLKKTLALKKRIRALQGGTSSGKTIAILEILIDMAQRDETPTLTSVVSESFPHLKRGAMRDFLNIMTEQRYFKPILWNKTDYTYAFETGSKIEFFSADQPGKVRGPRRQRLFLNEANNIPFETFEQLEVRTSDIIFMDWNPVAEFWFETDILQKRSDVDHLITTYKDNEGLSQDIVKSIESRKNRPGWWRVYGEGMLGEAEDRIYRNWQVIDEIPHEAKIVRRWLDFGYSIDETAIGTVYYYNGGYILDEETYLKGLSNKKIADILLNLSEPETLVIADSAEPKSIDELKSYGINVLPCVKGKDSVRNGIQIVQDQKISVTKRSLNILKEYRSYVWKRDREGRLTLEPSDIWDHHMSGIRYALSSLKDDLSPVEQIKRERELDKIREEATDPSDYGLDA
jgi:phage terminase large subunit